MPTSVPAASFVLRAESPARAVRAALDGIRAVEHPAGALLFLSGALGTRILEVAAQFRDSPPRVPLLLAVGSGVLSERGDVEGESALAGLTWTGGEADAFVVDGDDGDTSEPFVRSLAARAGEAGATVVAFFEPRHFARYHSLAAASTLSNVTLFGGGTTAELPIVAVSPSGKARRGPIGAMLFRKSYRSIVRGSPACRLLMPLRTITETRGAMVTSIEGEPALDVLKTVAADLDAQPLLLVTLAMAVEDGSAQASELLVRGVQGIDPERRGVMVGDDAAPGMRLAFAVRDGGAARQALESTVRELSREIAGAAPRFGIYVACAGRGSGLYGAPDVDVRLIRARFPELPLAGLYSSFEITPRAGQPAVQLYNGVLGVFASPS